MKKNELFDIHTFLSDLPKFFKGRICEECAWSIPTFYRKMRMDCNPDEDGKITHSLSNAEKDKIHDVLREVKERLQEYNS